MGVFGRLGAVLRSNVNALLDRAEDPETLIAATVDDMEAGLKNARRDLVTTVATGKRLEKRQRELEEEAAEWERKAVQALRQGNDELAREALRRKAASVTDAERAGEQAAAQQATAEQMREALERIERKLEDLKLRKGTLAAQLRRTREEARAGAVPHDSFAELSRMGSRIDRLEAELEAHEVLEDPHRAEVEAQLRVLGSEAESESVEDELASLKRRLNP